jgi:hypothetical protein
LQAISGVSALIFFYDIHGRKGEVLFFYIVSDTKREWRRSNENLTQIYQELDGPAVSALDVRALSGR